MRCRPVAVEHLDTSTNEPTHRQLRVPRRAGGDTCAVRRLDRRAATSRKGPRPGRRRASRAGSARAGSRLGRRAERAADRRRPGRCACAGLAWLRGLIGSRVRSPACGLGRPSTPGAGRGPLRPRRLLRLLRLGAGRPNQRQLMRRRPGLGVALVVERWLALRRRPQPDRRSRTPWRHLDSRHTRTANLYVCLRLPSTASVPGSPSHRQCPMWITAQRGSNGKAHGAAKAMWITARHSSKDETGPMAVAASAAGSAPATSSRVMAQPAKAISGAGTRPVDS